MGNVPAIAPKGKIGTGSSPGESKSIGNGQTMSIHQAGDRSSVELKSAFKDLPKSSMQTA